MLFRCKITKKFGKSARFSAFFSRQQHDMSDMSDERASRTCDWPSFHCIGVFCLEFLLFLLVVPDRAAAGEVATGLIPRIAEGLIHVEAFLYRAGLLQQLLNSHEDKICFRFLICLHNRMFLSFVTLIHSLISYFSTTFLPLTMYRPFVGWATR